MNHQDDYDEPGGRAWNGWPTMLAGFVGTAVLVVAFTRAAVYAHPKFWIVSVFCGTVTCLFVGCCTDFEWRARKAEEARLTDLREGKP